MCILGTLDFIRKKENPDIHTASAANIIVTVLRWIVI